MNRSDDKVNKMLFEILQSNKNTSKEIYEPQKISPKDIQENVENAEIKTNLSEILFEPNAYVHIMRKYHTFMYVFTRHFNFMLKAQFRKLFNMDQTTAKNEFKKLKEWKIIGEEKYKGNHYIYPKHRAFLYAGQHFNWDKNLPKTVKTPSESSLLMDLLRVEYFVQSEGFILSDHNYFFPDEKNASFIPKAEFEREGPAFAYILDFFEWTIEDLSKYKSFIAKKKKADMILDQESPPIIEEDILRDAGYSEIDLETSQKLSFHSELLGRHIYNTGRDGGWFIDLKNENTLSRRFSRMNKVSQVDYYTIINNAALLTLLNKNCYVTKIEMENNKQIIHLTILHTPGIEYSSYSNLIGDIQRLVCYQWKSTEFKVTVLADTKDQKINAFSNWKKAVEKRREYQGVNLEARERRNHDKYKKKGIINKITKKDYNKFVSRNYEFCDINEVEFKSLGLDKYYADLKNIAHPASVEVSIEERIIIDKSFTSLFEGT